MNHIQLFLSITLAFTLIPFIAIAQKDEDKAITVTVQGEGLNRSEALEDAFRHAIRKAVGQIVVSKSVVEDEDLREKLDIISDAMIMDFDELEKSENDGIVKITIEARVLKNMFYKYLPKQSSNSVNELEKENLLVKRKTLASALNYLDFIFNDSNGKLIQAQKTGDFMLASDDNVKSDRAKIIIPFELSFNAQEHAVFRKRMINLLDMVCVAKTSGKVQNYRYLAESHGDSASIIERFNRQSVSGHWPVGTQFILLTNRHVKEKSCFYHFICYAVPNQIYEKINKLINDFTVLVFQYDSNPDKPLESYIEAKTIFYRRYSSYRMEKKCIELRNWMGASLDHGKWDSFTSKNYHHIESFNLEDFQKISTCSIQVYTGLKAKFIFGKNYNRSVVNGKVVTNSKCLDYLHECVNEDYVPAMLLLGKIYKGNDSGLRYYSMAALRGNREAQKTLGWLNSGLGFEIGKNGYVLHTQQGLPSVSGMVVRSINDYKRCDYVTGLAKYIGSLEIGSTVSVQFTNEKTINFIVQD